MQANLQTGKHLLHVSTPLHMCDVLLTETIT